ncbi:MAG: hypothetical protein ACYCWW_01395 [Deltaproteobacteria bacterium]
MNATLPKRNAYRAPRGSAIVEFAISLVVFIPALLYSVFLCDTLFFQLKAQEITAAAAWDFTGRTLHDYSTSFNHVGANATAQSAMQKSIQKRYKGLDAWANESGAGSSSAYYVGAGARGQLKPSSVSCTPDNSMGGGGGVTNMFDPTSIAVAGQKLHTGGFVRCQVEVDSQNWYLNRGAQAQHFMDGPGWIGKTDLYDSVALGTISLCGVGTASSNSCGTKTAAFGITTDDWGLAADGIKNGTDSHTHWTDGNENDLDFYSQAKNSTDFYNVGKEVYEQSVPTGAAASALGASGLAGMLSYNRAIQAVEAQYVTGSYAEMGELIANDSAFGAFLLTERSSLDKVTGKTGLASDPAALDSTSQTSVMEHGEHDGVSGEGPQYSDTWPYYIQAGSSAPLSGNAYRKRWVTRTDNYLGM